LLEAFLLKNIFGVALVFARVGSIMFMMPGIGERYVSANIRLILALAISVALMAVTRPLMPTPPANFLGLAVMMIGEITVGVFIGSMVRFFFTSLDFAGQIIAQGAGLSAATSYNPAASTDGSLVSAFLGLVGLELFFLTDMHHLVLMAFAHSYAVFPVGGMLHLGDMAQTLTRILGETFQLGIRLAAPFLVISLVFAMTLGILARLMPQLQIFFVALPIQITVGLIMLSLVLPILFTVWLGYMQDRLTNFFPGL
jgi:flagellar biosynthetic protein FliR